jgi:hypothetical protein
MTALVKTQNPVVGHLVRIATPMIGGAVVGLVAAAAGIQPTLLGVTIVGMTAGFTIYVVRIFVVRRPMWPLEYTINWFMLFGVCIAIGLDNFASLVQ